MGRYKRGESKSCLCLFFRGNFVAALSAAVSSAILTAIASPAGPSPIALTTPTPIATSISLTAPIPLTASTSPALTVSAVSTTSTPTIAATPAISTVPATSRVRRCVEVNKMKLLLSGRSEFFFLEPFEVGDGTVLDYCPVGYLVGLDFGERGNFVPDFG